MTHFWTSSSVKMHKPAKSFLRRPKIRKSAGAKFRMYSSCFTESHLKDSNMLLGVTDICSLALSWWNASRCVNRPGCLHLIWLYGCIKMRSRVQIVVRLGTTWLCDITRVVVMVVWMVGAMCAVQHFRLCDQDREPSNIGPLQKKFVRHNGLTKMLRAVWRNLNIFSSFLTLQLRQIYKKNCGCVDVGRTTTFCMSTTRFMSHNLVEQSCMTKLLSMWTHL